MDQNPFTQLAQIATLVNAFATAITCVSTFVYMLLTAVLAGLTYQSLRQGKRSLAEAEKARLADSAPLLVVISGQFPNPPSSFALVINIQNAGRGPARSVTITGHMDRYPLSNIAPVIVVGAPFELYLESRGVKPEGTYSNDGIIHLVLRYFDVYDRKWSTIAELQHYAENTYRARLSRVVSPK